MDMLQSGVFYKEVSVAQVDNLVDFFNRSSQALKSAAAVDWARDEIRRMNKHMKSLQEELAYVLQQQGMTYMSVENLAGAFYDDAVSATVADTSDKTNYTNVRYQNIPLSIVNELNDLARRNSGPTMNRILGLTSEIQFCLVKIAKLEKDLDNIKTARKEFETKRDADPKAFENLRDQFIALSAIQGYVEALYELVNNYPKNSPTDNTVRTTVEKFDRSCILWRRYKRKLQNSVQEYKEKYLVVGEESFELPALDTINLLGKDSEGISYEDINKVLQEEYKIFYNKKENKYEVRNKNPGVLLDVIIDYMVSESEIPAQYTGVPNMRAGVISSLAAMRGALSVVSSALEQQLGTWSGGTAYIASNRSVSRVIDKAREAVNSPVRRTVTNPMTRDEYLSKTLIDFARVSKQVKDVREFLERKTEDLRDKVSKGLQKFDTEFLRKTFLRKAMPRKDYIKGMKPVEDAVRARVRARYGATVPFEDEVNIAPAPKDSNAPTPSPVFVKEQYVEQDPKTGEWHLKSDLALTVLNSTIDETKVNK